MRAFYQGVNSELSLHFNEPSREAGERFQFLLLSGENVPRYQPKQIRKMNGLARSNLTLVRWERRTQVMACCHGIRMKNVVSSELENDNKPVKSLAADEIAAFGA